MMSDFPPDFAIEHDQQTYRPVCVMPHTTQKGEQTRIVEWLTNCPTCGVEFTVTTTMVFKEPRRRCDGCKNPHRRVKADRRLFRAQIRGDKP
jgi:hypothetical protein